MANKHHGSAHLRTVDFVDLQILLPFQAERGAPKKSELQTDNPNNDLLTFKGLTREEAKKLHRALVDVCIDLEYVLGER